MICDVAVCSVSTSHGTMNWSALCDYGISWSYWVDIFVSIPINRVESKKEGKDQESIQSSSTPDPGYPWEAW